MKYFYIIIILSSLISCSQKEEKSISDLEINSIFVDVNNPETFIFTDFFDTTYIVPLDNSEILGSIDKLLITKENIIVLDYKKTNSIFIYNRKGELKSLINDYGEGPEKYSYPRQIFTSKDETTLYVYCMGRQTLLAYNLEGKLNSEFDLGKYGPLTDITYKNGLIYLILNDLDLEGNRAIVLDESFNPMGKLNFEELLPYTIGFNAKKPNFLYSKNGNGLYFQELNSEFLFSIDSIDVNNIMKFDFGVNSYDYIPNKIYDLKEFKETSLKDNKFHVSNNHIDAGDVIFLSVSTGQIENLIVFDKIKNRSHFIYKIENNMTGMMNFNAIWNSYNLNAGYLVVDLNPKIFNSLKRKVKIPDDYSDYINSISVDDFDNPILFIHKFKDLIHLTDE
ncbi:6-bladed beta-propeller [Algoriphagus chordae]|uniref:6-bladed beta-propeller protein n=1 Tax=Algoriphagus chordae TaxID=237019 RepID=A0A2W7QHP7_9BACT|nr:6-bladed beta-propeller [Algoriphagus chordae]PZX46836.1 6-bladed beta-propeller protein [Algoriphagus chordae]